MAKPTRISAFIFSCKVLGLQARRLVVEMVGGKPPQGRKTLGYTAAPVAAQSVTPLWTATSAAEFKLTAGKVENLRLAVRALDGLEFQSGEVFSFWRQIGRPVAGRGFVEGREVREGCIVPSIAGGLCQLSNALYDTALNAGLQIVERHAHTRVVPGSFAAQGRDATVFWNYVDLRFSSDHGMRIETELTGGDLVVSLRVPSRVGLGAIQTNMVDGNEPPAPQAASCETCGVNSCFRHQEFHDGENGSITAKCAVVVDAVTPELARWVEAQAAPNTDLFVPLDGARRGKANYSWPNNGFGTVREAPIAALLRSFASRRLAAQGAVRQRALLAGDRRLAAAFAKKLDFTVTHVAVAQNLLLPLWELGILGGRTFDVLMTRPPLAELQAALDRGAEANPQSRTLADFRLPPETVALESKALSRARCIVTPHTWIAQMFAGRTETLAWDIPRNGTRPKSDGRTVLFPGPTAGRKGAYEVRAAAKALGWRVLVLGSLLEGDDFWREVDHEHLGRDAALGLARCDAVVLPAYVENAPRVVLRAIGLGIPAIVSKETGVQGLPGVTVLPEISAEAVITAWNAISLCAAES